MPLSINALSHEIVDGDTRRSLFANLSLSVATGESVALMGDSGSGKTTLLNLIAGLEPIQSGDIVVAEHSLAQAKEQVLSDLRKRYISIIFQQFNLLSNISVRDNIEFSARLAGKFDTALCQSLVNELGIASLLDKFPSVLSGGEMQRVAIARALNAQPKLLLADEPTGNLDHDNSEHVVEQLVRLAKVNQTALLMVTHSREVAARMDKIYHLVDGNLTLVKG
ncbi:ABC transporter ATP-binding protein [Thalassotalea fusca]